jgi:hypothetical protein
VVCGRPPTLVLMDPWLADIQSPARRLCWAEIGAACKHDVSTHAGSKSGAQERTGSPTSSTAENRPFLAASVGAMYRPFVPRASIGGE